VALSAGQVSLPVKPDASGFGADLHKSIMGQSSGIGAIGKTVGVGIMAGAAAAMAAAGAVLTVGIGEAMDASAGTAQLEAGIKSTGGAAGVSADQLNALAGSIQGMSGQTDDSIVKAEQLLLTFTNIKNTDTDKIFDRATLASANMAAKMGGDAAGSAIQLGKALNDPVKGLVGLGRAGVQFTDAQKDAVKAMVDSGDTMGAQNIILGELETQFGGAAEAAGNSLPGQLEKGKRAFEDLSQTVVTVILPMILPAITGIADVIKRATPNIVSFAEAFSKNVKEAIDKAQPVIETVSSFVTVTLLPALSTAADYITGTVVPAIKGFADEFINGEGAGGKFHRALTAVVDYVTDTAVPAIKDMTTWVINHKTGLSALVTVVGGALVAYKGFQVVNAIMRTARTVQEGYAAASYGATAATYANSAAGRAGAIVYALMNSTVVKGVVGWWANTAAQLANTNGGLLAKAAIIGTAVATGTVTAVQWAWNAALSANPIGIVIVLIGALVAGIIWVATQTTFFQTVWTAVWGGITTAFNATVTFLKGLFNAVWESIKTVFGWSPLGIIITNWDAIVGFFGGLGAKIGTAASGMWDGIKDSFKSAINWVLRAWNDFQFTIGGGNVMGLDIPKVTLDTPNIPLLAKGGIVPATPGGRLVRVAEAGESEVVAPLSKFNDMVNGAGGKGITQNIYPSPGLSEQQIGDAAGRRLLGAMR